MSADDKLALIVAAIVLIGLCLGFTAAIL